MVGMISCVVLIFPWGQTGAPARFLAGAFFPELHPINFSLIWRPVPVAGGGELRCGAATLVAATNHASPILVFFDFFYLAGEFLEKPGAGGWQAGGYKHLIYFAFTTAARLAKLRPFWARKHRQRMSVTGRIT